MDLHFIKQETPLSENVLEVLEKAHKNLICSKKKDTLIFEFDLNGIFVLVSKDSNPKLLTRDWKRASHGLINTKIVGPYSEEDLGNKKHDLQKFLSTNH